MYFMLNEKVDEWHKGRKEGASKQLAVSDCCGILRAQGKAASRPW